MNYTDTSHSDPLRNFKYLVTLTGNRRLARMGFNSIKGLKATTKNITYREGGDPLTTRQLPGLTTFGDLTATRGYIMGDDDLYNWASDVFSASSANQPAVGGSFRNTMQISLQDRDGYPAKTWVVVNAWVKEYAPGDFDAEKEAIFINTIVIANEGFYEI